jgi:hypothetical protein
VYALDTDLHKLEALDHAHGGRIVTAFATRHNEKFSLLRKYWSARSAAWWRSANWSPVTWCSG